MHLAPVDPPKVGKDSLLRDLLGEASDINVDVLANHQDPGLYLMMLLIPNKSTTIITSRRVRTPGPARVNSRAAVESLLARLATGMSVVPTSVVVKETTNRSSKPKKNRRRRTPRTLTRMAGPSMPVSRAVRFLRQLLNPFSAEDLCRYPDGTMIPTAIVASAYRTTYVTTGSSTDLNGQLVAIAPVTTAQQVTVTSGGAGSTVTYTPANTWYDSAQTNTADYFLPIIGPGGTPPAGAPAPNGTFTSRNNNFPNAQVLSALMGSQRCVGLGLKISVAGLPSNTFIAPGRVYALQLPAERWHSWFGTPGTTLPGGGTAPVAALTNGVVAFPSEADLAALVSEGRGFSCTLDDVRRRGEIQVVWKPTSPVDFAFQPSPFQMLMDRVDDGFPYSSVTAALPFTVVADPISGASSGGPTRPEILTIWIYGAPAGVVYTTTYGMVTEYIPNPSGSAVVNTAVPVVDTATADTILNLSGEVSRESGGKFSIADVPTYLGGLMDSPIGRMVGRAALGGLRLLTGSRQGPPRAGAGGPMIEDMV